MKETILYKKSRVGKILIWTIWVEPQGDSGHPEIWIEFGQVDGKLQTTFDIISEGVNVGKANETTPLEQAGLMMERKITKQREEGYRDTIKEAQAVQTIDWDKRLPKNLCFYKPKNSIDAKKIAKLEKEKRLLMSVKYDGMCYIVRKSKELGVEIYSRRMELETDKFPHLISGFNKMPNGTILLGEMTYSGNKDHMKDFKVVTQICRSKEAEKAIRRQEEFGKVSYRIFDMAFANHKCLLTSEQYLRRYGKISDLVESIGSDYIKKVHMLYTSHTEALQYVRDNKLEGLVIYDANGIMKENEAFTWNGKSHRPGVLWKSKPKYEDDFIIRFCPKDGIGEFGKGKNNRKVKSVFMYQLDDNNQEVYLGKCGGGLSDKQRDFYTTAEYPRVWCVEYDAIQPGSGSLRYPVFNSDRTIIGDKTIDECMMSEEIKAARQEK